jgi:hypothetical protein
LGALYAPDGRYEHVPLRLVSVDQADIEVLAATARALARPTDPYGQVAEIIADFDDRRPGEHDGGLVMRTAQLAGVLDLHADADALILLHALAAASPTTDIVLTSVTETAYKAFADRFNRIWTLSDPLARWQY